MITFRQLVDEFRSRGRFYVRPRTMLMVALRFSISRAMLYHLINGRRGAADWTVRRIGDVTGNTESVVRKALANSKRKNR